MWTLQAEGYGGFPDMSSTPFSGVARLELSPIEICAGCGR